MNNQEKIKSALESIEHGLAAINTDKDWIRYLTFCSSFYNYSYNNIFLIMMQVLWQAIQRATAVGVTGTGVDSAATANGANSFVKFKNTDKLFVEDADDENDAADVMTEAEIKTALDANASAVIYKSIVYQDAKDGHTIYDVDGNVMDAKAITEAVANGGKMFTTSPTAAKEGKDYTVETKDKTVVSVKDRRSYSESI